MVFNQLSNDGSDTVKPAEIKYAEESNSQKYGIMFYVTIRRFVDAKGSAVIKFEEFLDLMVALKPSIDKDFKDIVDGDKTGKITFENYRLSLNKKGVSDISDG